MSKFTDRLNRAIRIRNIKPIDLANKSGISKSRISQYMNGLYDAKQDALFKIATALDVNVAWLMGHDVPMDIDYNGLREEIEICEQVQKVYGKDAFQLLSTYLTLNKDGKQAAITMLQGLSNNDNFKS